MDEAETNQALKALDHLLKQKKIQVKKLQEEIDTVNSRKANLSFELERERAKKHSLWWWILVASLFLLEIVSFQNGRYIIGLMCVYSFLSLWRGLYVRQTKHAVPIGICVLLLSLYAL